MYYYRMRFIEFAENQKKFLFGLLFLITVTVVTSIITAATLYIKVNYEMPKYLHFLSSVFDAGLAQANGQVICSDDWEHITIAKNEISIAISETAEEFFLAGILFRVDPVTGFIIEFSLGRSPTPYIASVLIWCVVTALKFKKWDSETSPRRRYSGTGI